MHFNYSLLLFQIGVFVYHAVLLNQEGESVGPEGPAYIQVRSNIDDTKITC